MWRPYNELSEGDKDAVTLAIAVGESIKSIRQRYGVREKDLQIIRNKHIEENPSFYSGSGRRLKLSQKSRMLISWMWHYGWSLREICRYVHEITGERIGRTSVVNRLSSYIAEFPAHGYEEIREHLHCYSINGIDKKLPNPGRVNVDLGYWQLSVYGRFVTLYQHFGRVVPEVWQRLGVGRDQVYEIRRRLISGEVSCREGVHADNVVQFLSEEARAISVKNG
jgi:hypothetical protein